MKISRGKNIIKALIIFGIIYSITIGLVEEPIGASQSNVGRIVVSADDWPICDSYWSTSASIFTLNTFGWLTEFSAGKRILGTPIKETDPLHTKNHMIDTLQTNGYSIDIIDTSSWTFALLAIYDVVVLEVGSINDTLLIEYVNEGGAVFLIGGHFGTELRYNEFLLHFGMSWHELVDLRESLTNFEPHPVTTGISSLEIGGPTPIEVHSSEPLILATWGSWNMLVVYSEELPAGAPTITVVSPNGGEYWGGAQMITWTTINSQGDPLTYTVYYSPNGGQTWTQLATGLTKSSYLWDTTTVINGATFLIRVEATDGTYSGVDVSDSLFEIANELTNTAPTVLVIRPNGGERVCGTYEIQWSANDPNGDTLTFIISYSPNGGDTWTQLASEVTGTSYQWDTSGVQVGENYLVKIEVSDGVLRAEDRSDAPFTVEREVFTKTHSEVFFMPSFRVVETLGALLVLLGLRERRRRRNKLMDGF